jgi:protein subunit release factor A
LTARYREIEELLCQPNVVSDAKRYTGLTKERAELQEVVETYTRYGQVTEDLAGHKEALSDPDLRELAAEEIPALEAERERLEASINLLLLPKDPNDQRNTHHPRDSERHRRRGGGSFRGGPLPHVFAIRGDAGLEGRSDVVE